MKRSGFTLIELMVVVAIIGLLAVIAIPSFTGYIAKAKRAEAYINLSSLYAAEKAYWAEHGTYTTNISGPGGLGWKPDGYKGGGEKERFNYTYGFGNGVEGMNYFTGKLQAPASALSAGHANKDGFMIVAAADIDGDGKLDVIGIDHTNAIIILQDDLQ